MEIRSFEKIPECIAIMMDGNRRWADTKKLTHTEGHLAGYEKLKEAALWVRDFGVKYLIVFAFSTENWGRSKEEVDALLDLCRFAFTNGFEDLKKEGIQIRVVGDRGKFPEDTQKLFRKTEEETKKSSACALILAFSYGGRAEIVASASRLASDAYVNGFHSIHPSVLTEDDIELGLWTVGRGVPDPDLIIRTGGEHRLSNFLLWQAAYAELFFSPTLWPDFSYWELLKILAEFQMRHRRFGK